MGYPLVGAGRRTGREMGDSAGRAPGFALLVSTALICQAQLWIWSQLDPDRSQVTWEPQPEGNRSSSLFASEHCRRLVLVWIGVSLKPFAPANGQRAGAQNYRGQLIQLE